MRSITPEILYVFCLFNTNLNFDVVMVLGHQTQCFEFSCIFALLYYDLCITFTLLVFSLFYRVQLFCFEFLVFPVQFPDYLVVSPCVAALCVSLLLCDVVFCPTGDEYLLSRSLIYQTCTTCTRLQQNQSNGVFRCLATSSIFASQMPGLFTRGTVPY